MPRQSSSVLPLGTPKYSSFIKKIRFSGPIQLTDTPTGRPLSIWVYKMKSDGVDDEASRYISALSRHVIGAQWSQCRFRLHGEKNLIFTESKALVDLFYQRLNIRVDDEKDKDNAQTVKAIQSQLSFSALFFDGQDDGSQYAKILGLLSGDCTHLREGVIELKFDEKSPAIACQKVLMQFARHQVSFKQRDTEFYIQLYHSDKAIICDSIEKNQLQHQYVPKKRVLAFFKRQTERGAYHVHVELGNSTRLKLAIDRIKVTLNAAVDGMGDRLYVDLTRKGYAVVIARPADIKAYNKILESELPSWRSIDLGQQSIQKHFFESYSEWLGPHELEVKDIQQIARCCQEAPLNTISQEALAYLVYYLLVIQHRKPSSTVKELTNVLDDVLPDAPIEKQILIYAEILHVLISSIQQVRGDAFTIKRLFDCSRHQLTTLSPCGRYFGLDVNEDGEVYVAGMSVGAERCVLFSTQDQASQTVDTILSTLKAAGGAHRSKIENLPISMMRSLLSLIFYYVETWPIIKKNTEMLQSAAFDDITLPEPSLACTVWVKSVFQQLQGSTPLVHQVNFDTTPKKPVTPRFSKSELANQRFSSVKIKLPDDRIIDVYVMFFYKFEEKNRKNILRRLSNRSREILLTLFSCVPQHTGFNSNAQMKCLYTHADSIYQAWQEKYPSDKEDKFQRRNDDSLRSYQANFTFDQLYKPVVPKRVVSRLSVEELVFNLVDNRALIQFENNKQGEEAAKNARSSLKYLCNILSHIQHVDQQGWELSLSIEAYRQFLSSLTIDLLLHRDKLTETNRRLNVFVEKIKCGYHFFMSVLIVRSGRKATTIDDLKAKFNKIKLGLGNAILFDYRDETTIVMIMTPEAHQVYLDRLKSGKSGNLYDYQHRRDFYHDPEHERLVNQFLSKHPAYLPPRELTPNVFWLTRVRLSQRRHQGRHLRHESFVLKCLGMLQQAEIEKKNPAHMVAEYVTIKKEMTEEICRLQQFIDLVDYVYAEYKQLHGEDYPISDFVSLLQHETMIIFSATNKACRLLYDKDRKEISFYATKTQRNQVLFKLGEMGYNSYQSVKDRWLSLNSQVSKQLELAPRLIRYNVTLSLLLARAYQYRLNDLRAKKSLSQQVDTGIAEYENNRFLTQLSVFKPMVLADIITFRENYLFVAQSQITQAGQGLYLCAPHDRDLELQPGQFITYYEGELQSAKDFRKKHPDKVTYACHFGISSAGAGGQVVVHQESIKTPSAYFANHAEDSPFELVPIEDRQLGVIAMGIRLKKGRDPLTIPAGYIAEVYVSYTKRAAREDHGIEESTAMYKSISLCENKPNHVTYPPFGYRTPAAWLGEFEVIAQAHVEEELPSKRSKSGDLFKPSKKRPASEELCDEPDLELQRSVRGGPRLSAY